MKFQACRVRTPVRTVDITDRVVCRGGNLPPVVIADGVVCRDDRPRSSVVRL
ncbi:MAG: hypothetical protein FWH14_01525 [Oscillospiraceae bacterium]|nr:hypothetical protein [Oscillospiraceae bacterium]